MASTVTWTHVTAARTETNAGQRIAPFAAGVVLPTAAVTAVLHCIASAFGDSYWFDEVYMLAIGRYHLDWGSADQPPLAPALAALTDAVAPGSLIAAYLDGYSKRYQLPEAYSANRSYGYLPPPPADRYTVLYIGRDPGALRAYFADIRRVGDVGEDMRAYLLTGQRQSWDQMWPRLRTLTVS
jgi:hypothetical protein